MKEKKTEKNNKIRGEKTEKNENKDKIKEKKNNEGR